MGQRTKRTPNLTAVGDIDLTEPESKVATPKKQEATKVAVSRSVSRHKPNQKNDEYTKKREKALQELRKNEGLDSAKPKQKLSNAEYTALRRSRKVQVNLELDLIEKS